jgi:outer membrane protein
MKRLMSLFLGAALLTGGMAYAAGNVKVGLVDMQHIFQDSPQVKAINKKLQKEFKPQQEKIEAVQKKVQSEAQKLHPQKSKSLKPAEKKTIEKRISQQQQKLQTMVSSFRQQVKAAQSKKMDALKDNLDSAVEKMAKKDDLDVVILKQAVLYAKDSKDITQDVLDSMPKN